MRVETRASPVSDEMKLQSLRYEDFSIVRGHCNTTDDSKYCPAPLLMIYVEAGWLDRKTGRGLYDYTGDVPVPTR